MRLFVALDLPGSVKDSLAGVIEELRPSAPEAKWVPRDNLHLTLSFLGEVAEGRVPGLTAALQGAAAEAYEFEARLGGVGAFPSRRRARVLWVGLEDDVGSLARLAEATAAALEPLGFAREKRAWTPHLTIARFRVPGDVSNLPDAAPPTLRFPMRELTLFRSRLGRPAPTYEAVSCMPLGER